MRVITINTYAGSLLVAARAANFPVDYSLEDSDFGMSLQRANFPDLKIVKDPRYWPDVDLYDHCVIAHPPCSAFSNQNNSDKDRGVDAGAFKCTTQVLDYAMSHRARVVLVESVVGAYEGAEAVHVAYANRYGYSLYRFLVNSASFGVPQWRPRFWAAFVNSLTPGWPVYYKPTYRKLKDVMVPENALDSAGSLDYETFAAINKQLGVLTRENVPRELVREILAGRRGFGQLPGLIGGKEKKRYEPGGFQSKHVRLLDPEGVATTLLLDAHWIFPCEQPDEPTMIRWRRLYDVELLRIMGFPDDYKIPFKEEKKLKVYLSKGVCPPVAEWFLRQAVWWWGVPTQVDSAQLYTVLPGQVLDLRIKKNEMA